MKVRLNDDPEIVKTIREGLKRTGGYCPCRLARTEENRCMCKEFKPADFSHCGLLTYPFVKRLPAAAGHKTVFLHHGTYLCVGDLAVSDNVYLPYKLRQQDYYSATAQCTGNKPPSFP